MKKILTVLGARPQFIKASVVSAEIENTVSLEEIVVHTGQHFDHNMSDVFFEELGMKKPQYHLGVHGGGHGEMTGRMLIEVEQVLNKEQPDIVLVYGDTNSTLAGALAASKLHIPVAHIEAGLRSFNMRMPEEINRILTDRISNWLFTPTNSATHNLQREGVSADLIKQVGDVMYDVARFHGSRASENAGLLSDKHLAAGKFILATIHRAENTDHPARLSVIVDALIEVSGKLMPVVWPLHPRTRQTLISQGLMQKLSASVILIEPVGYMDMVSLEKFAGLIITDSGGVQKEAFFHETPCVTLRDETEWVELVQAGWNRLAPPTSVNSILDAVDAAMHVQPQSVAPYGDGTAAQQIVRWLA